MIYILLNLAAISVATIAGLLIGIGYLRTAGLGRPATGGIVAAVIAEFWLCAILAGALILAPPKASPWTMAIGSAVVIWIGFVVPALVVAQSARRLGARAIAADCLHWLVVMVVQALVLKSWGLIPPPA
jgi:hypothetical protein